MTLPTLDYNSQPTRSRLASAAFILGIIALPTSLIAIGILPGLAAIVIGLIAEQRITRHPHLYSGLGHTRIGAVCGIIASFIATLAILTPSLGGSGLAPRSYCVANMRGIAQSLNVYAADNNDRFPTVPFAPYSQPTATTASVAGTQPDAVNSLFASTSPHNGSILANEWILVLNNYCAPRVFICKSDPLISGTPAQLSPSPNSIYTNFQSPTQNSYSFAYPYAPDHTVGPWWKNNSDSSLPVASDIAPLNNTGKPKRNLSPGSTPKIPATWNSINHNGDGQNVAYSDGHAEFNRSPNVGQSNDNIFTLSPINAPNEFTGSQPTSGTINIQTPSPPYDTLLLPTRNLDTGSL